MKLIFPLLLSIIIISCSNKTNEPNNDPSEDTITEDTTSKAEDAPIVEEVIDTVKRYLKSEVNEITSYETGVYTKTATLKENGAETDIPVNGIVYDVDFRDQIKYEASYNNGKLDGLLKKYHSNGNIKSEEPYINGERHGTYTAWSLDGNVVGEIVYDNSMIVSKKRWDDEGNLLEDYDANK